MGSCKSSENVPESFQKYDHTYSFNTATSKSTKCTSKYKCNANKKMPSFVAKKKIKTSVYRKTRKHTRHIKVSKSKQNSSIQETEKDVPIQITKEINSALPCTFVNKKQNLAVLDNVLFAPVARSVDGECYDCYNVPGDGNCFFHCLSLSLHGHFEMSKQYRREICSTVVNNWHIYEHDVKLHHCVNMTKEKYQSSMVDGNGYATKCEIQVAASIVGSILKIHFRCQILSGNESFLTEVFSPQQNVDLHTPTIDLFLLYEHFQVLRKKQDITLSSGQSYLKRKAVDNCLESGKRAKLSEKYCIQEEKTRSTCRKVGIHFEKASENENNEDYKRRDRRNKRRVKSFLQKKKMTIDSVPNAAPLVADDKFNSAMDSIRAFELEQMSYGFNKCEVCHERRIEMKMFDENTCYRCKKDTHEIKLFSSDNNMNPGQIPLELQNLTVIEQQLIARISPCINVHMVKHGGIASKGHCVTFPQEVNEPAKIFPRLPREINIIKVRRQGSAGTSKDFKVHRYVIQSALEWLKTNNTAYSDIIIDQARLNQLPEDGDLEDTHIVEFDEHTGHQHDIGPAPNQTDPGDVEGVSHSSILLPDISVNIQEKVQNVVKNIVTECDSTVTLDKRGTVIIPWPTRGSIPLSEITTQNFFTLAFPTLFPYVSGDFHINRPRTVTSLSDWAEHLLWFEDGRFARHPYFKFVVHNMIMRKKALEQSSFIINQKLGEGHVTITDLKEKLKNGDQSIASKILYFGANLRGTSQYWSQRSRELRSLVQFQINQGNGLPSFFTTGSCAEFHFKPLRRLLKLYIKDTVDKDIDLSDRNILFSILQEHTHIVSHYFDLRTKSYFEKVMGPVFGVSAYWYRQEFAKSRGMIHWHGLCWRHDRQPHNLLHTAVQDGLSDSMCAEQLAKWASSEIGLSAMHPAGSDSDGNPRKNLWPPPEGSAPAPDEDKNPLVKLLLDVCSNQESLLEDYLLLTNRVSLHRCSDYCLKTNNNSKSSSSRVCRMEFGTENNPGKLVRNHAEIVKDRNGSMRLEMPSDHPALVQNSRFHTQGWRANGDISVILSKSNPENPSVDEILATEKYITGYACKGNEPTGAMADLFNDMVNSSNEESATGKSVCSKLLMNTVKRDVSASEVSFELSSLPLYRCSFGLQNISLSGCRVLEKNGNTVTKNTALDNYLSRDENDISSLYQFVCNRGRVPVLAGNNAKASWPLDENYCRSMLILHWPNWRKIELIKNDKTWTEKMHEFLSTEACPNFLKADVEGAKKRHFKNVCADDDDDAESNYSETDDETDSPDWVELIRPYQAIDVQSDFQYDDGGPDYNWSAMLYDYPMQKCQEWIETINHSAEANINELILPDVDLHMMNSDQKFAFDITMFTLSNYLKNDADFEPLRLIVSGTAGTGKSFLIKCLVKAIRSLFQTNKSVQVVCPTGNSANIISGVTLHSYLKVPTKKRGKDMTPPDGTTGESLQTNCEGLEVLLVDERSLIGTNTLGWMEYMCRHGVKKGSKSDESWGGLPVVIFFGDDVQLPPVLDSPVYNNKGHSPASRHGELVWHDFQYAVTLTTIVRQSTDEKNFRDVLMALREYKATKQQATWLQRFQWKNLQISYGDKLLNRMNENGLFVFPSHEEEWQHNKLKLLDANIINPIAKLNAICHGPHSRSNGSDKSGGLQQTLFLCKTAKVMLSVNLCVPYGLFNGAPGTVIDIIYEVDHQPSNALPMAVFVEFPSYTGPVFLPENPKLVPLVPVERKVDCFCQCCRRKQVPLRLGWATTIHRCQGMTIGQGESNRYIVINPGTRGFESKTPGALFVALSRAKSAGKHHTDPDFAWHPSVLINEDRVCFKVNTSTVIARTKEIKRIQQSTEKTKNHFQSKLQTDNVQQYISTITEE